MGALIGGGIMAKITVENVPENLYRALVQSAKENQRSLQDEIIFRLEQSVANFPLNIDTFIAGVRILRAQTAVLIASDDELIAAKNTGRP
jgi:hypothetical protein